MFKCSDSATRIVGRLLAFILTASIGQALTSLVYRPVHRRLPSRELVAIPERGDNELIAYSPVRIINSPNIDFPKSLRTLNTVDFWIASSFVVNANGEVEKISVPADRESTLQDPSFINSVKAGVSPKQGELIQEQIFEIVRKQLEGTRFAPRINEGKHVATQLYMSSNFRWDGASCAKVGTVFTTSSGIIWDRAVADISNGLPCVER